MMKSNSWNTEQMSTDRKTKKINVKTNKKKDKGISEFYNIDLYVINGIKLSTIIRKKLYKYDASYHIHVMYMI